MSGDLVLDGLVVEPGDVLVVRLSMDTTMEQLDMLAREFERGPLKGRTVLVTAEQFAVLKNAQTGEQ